MRHFKPQEEQDRIQKLVGSAGSEFVYYEYGSATLVLVNYHENMVKFLTKLK
jgi:hypothetical protein